MDRTKIHLQATRVVGRSPLFVYLSHAHDLKTGSADESHLEVPEFSIGRNLPLPGLRHPAAHPDHDRRTVAVDIGANLPGPSAARTPVLRFQQRRLRSRELSPGAKEHR